MVKKYVVWGLGLVFVAALSFPAFANQSIGYWQYYNEGVKAFKEHDDQKALRCFIIAHIYDPSDRDVDRYLSVLDQRGVILELHPSLLAPQDTIGYRYYFGGGREAFYKHNDRKAARYFDVALIFYPGSTESQQYLRVLHRRHGLSFFNETTLPQVLAPAQLYMPSGQVQPGIIPSQLETIISEPAPAAPAVQATAQPHSNVVTQVPPQPEASMPKSTTALAQSQPSVSPSQPQSVTLAPPSAFYVTAPKPKQPPMVLQLDEISNVSQLKARLQIDLNSSVILEGKNIQRFLIVQEGYIQANIIDSDHIKIDAKRIGTTFLHIWDNLGRHTLYVEVVFPKIVNGHGSQETNGVYHSTPFTAIYSNDWDTYYSGRNAQSLKRQSYEFTESLVVTGETPYGFFDTSGSYSDFNNISNFDSYSIGLSQIPVEGTSNFNLRAFDAFRYLSPLTMPGTTLRGAFADVDLMGDVLGLSVSHGQEQVPLGFLSEGANEFNNSYIDAFKLTLFPKSLDDQYSFNFATGYGSDRESYLSDHVYSFQEQHRFDEHLLFNAEEGSDTSHESELASLKWQEGAFKSGLNFRNVDKDYATVSTLPAYQGETGATWTTDTDLENIREDTFFEAYQDHLYGNPNDPRAFNYDGNGQLRVNLTPNVWSDSDFNFVDNLGELSPNRSFSVDQRLSRNFPTWNVLKGTVFTGVGYQNSHSSDSNISNYNREDVIAGIQLPLTTHVSAYANYEYDWLQQTVNGDSNPNIINVGLGYQRPINPKLSFTSQIDYHDELGVKPDGYLSGEQSVIYTAGFTYSPMLDVNFFADANASKVLSHIGNTPYDDFEVHLGMRITFGGATYWDPLGTVSGIVFKDRSGSGKFEPGDEGVPGVKVKVGDKIAVTDKFGRYRIKIRAKGVDVTPVEDTVPGGLLFSTPQLLNVRVVQGRVSHADFGLTSQTGVYGIVFVDKNGSGIPNESDKFVGKVRVILDGKTMERSDSHGAFYFRHVSPGEHIISIDLNSLALDMVPSIKLKNKIDVAEGTNYMFNIPVQIKQAQGEQE